MNPDEQFPGNNADKAYVDETDRGAIPYVRPRPGENYDIRSQYSVTPPVNTTIFIATDLLLAHSRFVREQTEFLENNIPDSEDYLKRVTHYSREQTKLIRALTQALEQAGII